MKCCLGVTDSHCIRPNQLYVVFFYFFDNFLFQFGSSRSGFAKVCCYNNILNFLLTVFIDQDGNHFCRGDNQGQIHFFGSIFETRVTFITFDEFYFGINWIYVSTIIGFQYVHKDNISPFLWGNRSSDNGNAFGI